MSRCGKVCSTPKALAVGASGAGIIERNVLPEGFQARAKMEHLAPHKRPTTAHVALKMQCIALYSQKSIKICVNKAK